MKYVFVNVDPLWLAFVCCPKLYISVAVNNSSKIHNICIMVCFQKFTFKFLFPRNIFFFSHATIIILCVRILNLYLSFAILQCYCSEINIIFTLQARVLKCLKVLYHAIEAILSMSKLLFSKKLLKLMSCHWHDWSSICMGGGTHIRTNCQLSDTLFWSTLTQDAFFFPRHPKTPFLNKTINQRPRPYLFP